mmetsp:Transcript_10123/g.42515  ORF Transcript_10123/g.42515 Transcript_10123/m.42515 type:complete len:81 (-) Transcript_10123:542-784(-)
MFLGAAKELQCLFDLCAFTTISSTQHSPLQFFSSTVLEDLPSALPCCIVLGKQLSVHRWQPSFQAVYRGLVVLERIVDLP